MKWTVSVIEILEGHFNINIDAPDLKNLRFSDRNLRGPLQLSKTISVDEEVCFSDRNLRGPLQLFGKLENVRPRGVSVIEILEGHFNFSGSLKMFDLEGFQ